MTADGWLKQIKDSVGGPQDAQVEASRQRVESWFQETAPLIRWDGIETPIGMLYFAVNARGLCRVALGGTPESFQALLDPLAHLERSGEALAEFRQQLAAYFAGERAHFDLPLDMGHLRPFQRRVLQVALSIPAGTVWTYGQVARAIGQPKASRAVGRALGSNPMPVVIPCHRVIGSDGKLHGYGTGDGLPTKRWLLQFEGAL